MSKNMPADALGGPYAQQQKLLLYVLPVAFGLGGVAFPIGVLLYWTTSNLWTMGQQFYVIRNNPAPGTPAFQAKVDRDRAKAARKGTLVLEEAPRRLRRGRVRRPVSSRRSRAASSAARAVTARPVAPARPSRGRGWWPGEAGPEEPACQVEPEEAQQGEKS